MPYNIIIQYYIVRNCINKRIRQGKWTTCYFHVYRVFASAASRIYLILCIFSVTFSCGFHLVDAKFAGFGLSAMVAIVTA